MKYMDALVTFENGTIIGNNGDIRPPSAYKVATNDIDLDSKRATSGYLHRNRIQGGNTGTQFYTLTLTWERITWEELRTLYTASDSESFEVTFLDPKTKTGSVKQRMYRDANTESTLINISNDKKAFWSVTVTFIGGVAKGRMW